MDLKSRYEKVKKDLKDCLFDQDLTSTVPLKLIAVSKKFPTSDIEILYKLGHKDFAENYVTELTEKFERLKHLDIHWHFIGHLQTNKVSKIVGLVDLIHSVDSEKLLKKIIDESEKKSLVQKVLLQIKFGDESTKYGFEINQVEKLIFSYIKNKNIKFCGLMCILPLDIDDSLKTAYFLQLKNKLSSINLKLDLSDHLKELSMGMSDDFKLAIESGSTMIRIGSSIFGARQ